MMSYQQLEKSPLISSFNDAYGTRNGDHSTDAVTIATTV